MDETRKVKTDITLYKPYIKDGLLYGARALMSFTVSPNSEAKALGEFAQIEDLIVTFDGVLLQNVLADALAQRKVKWQTRRDDIEKLAKMSGQTISFDHTFGRAPTRTAPITEATAMAFINSLPADQREEFLLKLTGQRSEEESEEESEE